MADRGGPRDARIPRPACSARSVGIPCRRALSRRAFLRSTAALRRALAARDQARRLPGNRSEGRQASRATCTDDHLLPRAVGMPRSSSAAAMARIELNTGRLKLLEWSGRPHCRLRARSPPSCSCLCPSIEPHGSRPSCTPRRSAAARTAFVRAGLARIRSALRSVSRRYGRASVLRVW